MLSTNKAKISKERLAALKFHVERVSAVKPQENLRADDIVNSSHFELIKLLGNGAQGNVFLVRKKGGKDSGNLYAMKVIKKDYSRAEHLKREREILETIRESPFLVTLHYAFQTESKLYFVLDYANGGELFSKLNRKFSKHQLQVYLAEIILAIENLHSLRIVHRDIKAENIMLDAGGHIVLIDFGSAKVLKSEQNFRANSFCGTTAYMAPEIINNVQSAVGYGFSVDYWSFGVLAYELATGCTPFGKRDETSNCKETVDATTHRILHMKPNKPTNSVEFNDLIDRLLHKDATQRLGCGPKGVDEIKSHKFFEGINWERLTKKEIRMPFRPTIEHPLDTKYFSKEFTDKPAVDAPVKAVPNHERYFKGFPFVAPEHQNLPSPNSINSDVRPKVYDLISENNPASSETNGKQKPIVTEAERKFGLRHTQVKLKRILSAEILESVSVKNGRNKRKRVEAIDREWSIETAAEKEFGLRHAQVKLKRISSTEISESTSVKNSRNKRKRIETIDREPSTETAAEKKFGLRHAQVKLKRISSADIVKLTSLKSRRNKHYAASTAVLPQSGRLQNLNGISSAKGTGGSRRGRKLRSITNTVGVPRKKTTTKNK